MRALRSEGWLPALALGLMLAIGGCDTEGARGGEEGPSVVLAPDEGEVAYTVAALVTDGAEDPPEVATLRLVFVDAQGQSTVQEVTWGGDMALSSSVVLRAGPYQVSGQARDPAGLVVAEGSESLFVVPLAKAELKLVLQRPSVAARGEVDLTVSMNTAPSVDALLVTPTQVTQGGILWATVQASDPDGDPLAVTITLDGVTSTLEPTASGAWTTSLAAPSQLGPAEVQAVATDPSGASATASVSIEVIAPPDGGPSPGVPDGFVQLYRLNWIGDPTCGTPTIPNSAIGEAKITLDAGNPLHHAFLADEGGAYVNVSLSANDGPTGWMVRNLFLVHPTLEHLHGASTSVQFRFPGINHGDPISPYMLHIHVSPNPMSDPFDAIDLVNVYTEAEIELRDYRVGGVRLVDADGQIVLEGSSGCSSIPSKESYHYGKEAPGQADPDDHAKLRDLPNGQPYVPVEIHEAINCCAPASVTRSLHYLAHTNEEVSTPTNEEGDDMTWQEVADQLAQDDYIGCPPSVSTNPGDNEALAGKDRFTSEQSMPIDSVFPLHWPEAMPADGLDNLRDQLAAGADIEIYVAWSGGGAHMAMVTQMTPTRDEDGNVVSYTLTYVDANQSADPPTPNVTRTIEVDRATGTFPGGTVHGAMVETVSTTAE